MADLGLGRYKQTNPFWSVLGQPTNVVQANIPAFSNLDYLGMASLADTAAALTTATMTVVPIPVDIGQTITKVLFPVGGTAEATGTHLFTALYSGIAVPALLGQSTDNTGAAAAAASAVFSSTLATPVVTSQVNAPNGYIYAGICCSATTVPSLAAVSVVAAVAYQWTGLNANSPLGFAFRFASATGTAPATITSITAQAGAPLVFLT